MLVIRRQLRSTRTYTLFPYATLFRAKRSRRQCSVQQHHGKPVPPARLIGPRQRVEVARRRARIIDPLAQARAAVDHVDREHIVGVLIFEILAAPDRVIRMEAADRQIGRAAGGERGWQYGAVSGEAGELKKKNKTTKIRGD